MTDSNKWVDPNLVSEKGKTYQFGSWWWLFSHKIKNQRDRGFERTKLVQKYWSPLIKCSLPETVTMQYIFSINYKIVLQSLKKHICMTRQTHYLLSYGHIICQTFTCQTKKKDFTSIFFLNAILVSYENSTLKSFLHIKEFYN